MKYKLDNKQTQNAAVAEKEKLEQEKQKAQNGKNEEEKNHTNENMMEKIIENPDSSQMICVKLKWGGVVYLEVVF